MGMDFIRRAAPAFRKGLDRMRIKLATPTLFTQQPESKPRSYAAKLQGDRTAACGEKLGIRLEGEQVHAMRGLDLVLLCHKRTHVCVFKSGKSSSGMDNL